MTLTSAAGASDRLGHRLSGCHNQKELFYMKMLATIVSIVTVGVFFSACSQYGARGSVSGGQGYAAVPDLGMCQQGRIDPHRQDQLCNRQNGNPYN